MVINNTTTVRSRAKPRYASQMGKVASTCGEDEGGDCVGGVGEADGGGVDEADGGGLVFAGSVVKALTALQSLWLVEPLALTFQ